MPSAAMVMAMVQGAVLCWPKPTPPVRAIIIVDTDVAAAFRRDGVGNGARHRVVLAEANATRESQCHCGCGLGRCRPPRWRRY